jgi:biopolymer transport protein ExbB
MKNKFKFIGLTIFFSTLILANNNCIFAQENDTVDQQTTTLETDISNNESLVEEESNASFHQVIKQKFIEGGPGFMGIVLLCLILGLALAIERIIYLNMATTDTDKLLSDVEGALDDGSCTYCASLSFTNT